MPETEQIVEEQPPKENSEQEQQLSPLDILKQHLEKPGEEKTATPKEETVEPPKTKTADVEVVTQDMVTNRPSLKNYLGKPLSEVVGYYDQQNKEFHETKRRLAELEKQLKKPEEEVAAPDPLEDVAAFNEYQKKIARDEAGKVLDERSAAAKRNQEMQDEMFASISEAIPKGFDPLKAMKSYFTANKDELMEGAEVKKSVIQFYAENPKILSNNIAAHILSTMSKAEIVKRGKVEAYNFTKDNLANAQKANVKTSIPRGTGEEVSDTDKLVGQLIEMNFDPAQYGE